MGELPDIGTFTGKQWPYTWLVESDPIERLSNTWTQCAKVTKLLRFRRCSVAEELALPEWEEYGTTPGEAIAKAHARMLVWAADLPVLDDDAPALYK